MSLTSPVFIDLAVATTVVPLLAGLFWGAPMVAHELETGTLPAWRRTATAGT